MISLAPTRPAQRSSPMLALAALLCSGARAPLDKPNVVVFFVDDLGYGDVGFNGHPTTLTPEIDRLAYSGKVLTTWYSACPVCSCSRASLLTGRQWSRMGIPGVLSPTTNSGLPLNETTLAAQLKAAGYATGVLGKWHLGQRAAYLPAARGFDSYLGIPYSDDMGLARASPCENPGGARGTSGMTRRPGEAADAAQSTTPESSSASVIQEAILPYVEAGLTSKPLSSEFDDPAGGFLPLVEQRVLADGKANTTVVEQPVDLTTLGPRYRKFVSTFIDEHAASPFFLYVPFSHVHTTASNQPAKQYCDCDHKNATARGPFGDALAEVDTLVGLVEERLKANGIAENTLILFTGDNGPWLIQGTSGGSEGLFSGRYAGYWNVGKGSTWEGGIREAGFAHWPGVIKPFTRSSEIVSSMDIFPTVLGLAGVHLPTDRVYDGKDMRSILLEDAGKSGHEVLFFYGGAGLGNTTPSAARFGPFKAHFATGPGLSGCGVSPSAPVGCPVLHYSGGPLVFNVEHDPSEAHPLSANTTTPEDPLLRAVVAKIMKAYDAEVASLTPHTEPPAPDQPGEKPGEYGICCDRARGCDCDGPPST